jgi:hypothetical protein
MSDKNKQLFDEEQASEASQNVVNSKIIELTRDIVEVPLPSKGLVYGPSHPLHGKESTSIVELTPLEESVMYDKQKIRNGTVIDDLVQVCLYDKSLNVQTILSGDRDILFALIRAEGFDENYSFDINCPKCEMRQEIKYNIYKHLRYKSLDLSEVKQVEPFANRFLFTAPKSGLEIEYKYSTVGESKKMAAEKKERQKMGSDPKFEVAYELSGLINSINGIKSRKEILDILCKLPGKDSTAFRKHIMKTEPGLDTSFDFVCKDKECGHTEKLDIKIEESFFFPHLGK